MAISAALRPGTDRVHVTLCLVLGLGVAVFAALTDGEPTALSGVDLVLRLGLAVLLVLAGSRSAPVPMFVASALAVAATVAGGAIDVGVVAAGVALAASGVQLVFARATHLDQWSPLGAAVGAALAVTVFSLEWPDRTGGPTLVAALIALIVVAAGWWDAAPQWRTRLGWIAFGAVVFVFLATVASAVSALQARTQLEAAVDSARAGLDDLDDLSQREAALAHLADAEQRFTSANRQLDAWWAKPALAVPVVSQHVDALQTMGAAGERLSSSSVDALEAADPERLRIAGGRIDLVAMREVADLLGAAVGDLTSTRSDLDGLAGPWLLDLLETERHDLAVRLDDAIGPASDAAEGADIAVSMLGSDSPKRYLLMMVTNSENRGIGGWYGSYGLVEANGGDMSLLHVGRTGDELRASPVPVIDAPQDYVERYALTYDGPGDVRTTPFTPDFSVAGDALVQAYAAVDPQGVDGVIAVDAYGLAALMQLTGPVTVPSWPEPLTTDNVVRLLLLDQYAEGGSAERGEFQGEVADAVWEKLVDGDLASADDLVDVLAPVVRGRRVQAFAVDERAQSFFERVDAAGVMAPVQGDYIGVVTQNIGGNKIDWFLRREVDYRVVYDPDSRQATAKLRVTLHNDAPADGLSPLVIGNIEGLPYISGVNRTWFNIYSAMSVRSATLDGQPLAMLGQRELGRLVYSTELSIAPGATVVVELDLGGTLDTLARGDPYRLDVLGQPVVGVDQLNVEVTGADGWQPSAPAADSFLNGAQEGGEAITVGFTQLG